MIEYQPFVPPLPREFRPKFGYRKPPIDNGDGSTWWPMAGGQYCLIDTADVPLVSRHLWHLAGDRTPYAATKVGASDGRQATLYMHNYLMGRKGVDHRTGNYIDNRRCNLRPASRASNLSICRCRSTSRVICKSTPSQ